MIGDSNHKDSEVNSTVGEITPATVTVKANDRNMYIGRKIPTLTYTATGSYNGDTLTKAPTLTSDADAKTLGAYPITASGAEASSNYVIVYEDGILTVSPSPSYDSGDTTSVTTKNKDGPNTTTTTNKTTGAVTETTKTADGTTGTVVTHKRGNVTEVSVTVPVAAAQSAEKSDKAVKLPVEVNAADKAEDAVEI